MDANITLKVTALDKLVDYAASGIGSVAGAMLGPWKARKEAEAQRIAARGEADALVIEAEGHAEATMLIVSEQEKARELMASPQTTSRTSLTISDGIEQRVRFQEEKRQRNIASVVQGAADELGDGEVPDHDPDHDWTARFFSDVQDVSNEEMQGLWSKILADEVKKPGSTSIKTLSILKGLNSGTASLFQLFCSACVIFELDGQIVNDARVLSLGGNAGDNALKQFGLDFGRLNVLNEHGLIISDYNSWYNYKACTGVQQSQSTSVVVPFRFIGKWRLLTPLRKPGNEREFRLHGVSLTKSGIELLQVIELVPQESYQQALGHFLEQKGYRMIEVENFGLYEVPIPVSSD